MCIISMKNCYMCVKMLLTLSPVHKMYVRSYFFVWKLKRDVIACKYSHDWKCLSSVYGIYECLNSVRQLQTHHSVLGLQLDMRIILSYYFKNKSKTIFQNNMKGLCEELNCQNKLWTNDICGANSHWNRVQLCLEILSTCISICSFKFEHFSFRVTQKFDSWIKVTLLKGLSPHQFHERVKC